MSSERKQVARATWVVSGATMISRVFGYIRDAVIAAYFGTGTSADAFIAAFKVPNFLRRLFGEGALTVSFVPVFTEELERKGEPAAKELASVVFTAFFALLSLITVVGVIFAPQIVWLMVPGFEGVSEKAELTVYLTRVMFPYVLLICLVALAMGILNSTKHFFAPAFAPVLLNVSMIAAAMALTPVVDPPSLALAIGVVAGGVVQLLFQIPFLYKKGYLPRIRVNPSHPGLRKIAFLLLPALFGMAVHTLAVFINSIFASMLREGSVSCFFYADRLMELPLGVFAIAVGTAVLPSMSRQAAKLDFDGLKDTMGFGIKLVLFITLPATAGMVALSEPIINVLFQRGAFDLEATQITAQTLVFFCLGLPFFSILRVVVPVFYSMKDTLTPVLLAVTAVVTTLLCDVLFIGPVEYPEWPIVALLAQKMNITGPLGVGGLALATSVGAMVNCIGLTFILKTRIGRIGGRAIAFSVSRSLLAAAVMGVAVWYPVRFFDFTTDGFGVVKVAALAGIIALGMAVYAGVAAALGSPELQSAVGIFRRKFGRKKATDENAGSGQ